MRLDLWLAELYPGISRRRAQEAIRKGQVDVDGDRVVEPGFLVKAGAKVKWDENRPALRRIRTPLRILHEDPHLIVVAKPAGLLTVPTDDGGEAETLQSQVREYVTRRDGRKGWVGVVHRLDRDTTGVLVFATSREAENGLRELFVAHRIDRVYDALVVPAPHLEEGTVRAPISRRMIAGRRRVVDPDDPDGQPAATHWKIVARWPAGARIEVTLETGRQHQIRIHLSHVGTPVLGDPTYYARQRAEPVEAPRTMLHARLLGFVHPVTGAKVKVELPPPEDFDRAGRKLAAARPVAPTRDDGRVAPERDEQVERYDPRRAAPPRRDAGARRDGGARRDDAGRPGTDSRRAAGSRREEAGGRGPAPRRAEGGGRDESARRREPPRRDDRPRRAEEPRREAAPRRDDREPSSRPSSSKGRGAKRPPGAGSSRPPAGPKGRPPRRPR